MFKLMDPGSLYWFDEENKETGWSRLETMQHYEGAVIPNPRSTVGWTRFHTENQYRFLKSLQKGAVFSPGAVDGARAQSVLDAAYESARSGREQEIQSIFSAG